jgi:plasmid maintenance system antidote protein VapI
MSEKQSTINIPHYQNKQPGDIEGEIWQDIPGLEGYGMISNLGRVKRLAYESVNELGRVTVLEERIQTQKVQQYFNTFKQDYKVHLQTRIQVEKVAHSIAVGRLVYYCFVKKFDLSDRSLYVSYKDGNGLNVLPDNLFLTDLSGLQQQIMKAGRKDLHFGHSGENQKVFTLLGREVNIKRVSQYDMAGKFVATHESITAAAKALGITSSAISAVIRRNQGLLTAGGFIWRLGRGKSTIPVKRIHQAIRATKGAPVSQYDLDGNKINTYYNITQAAKAVSVDRKAISDAVNGHILVTAGSVWRKGEAEQIDVNKERTSLSLRKGYTISRYDTDGVKQATYTSSKEAGASIGVAVERVNAMAIRDDLLLDGSIWRYGDASHLPQAEVDQVRENLKKERAKNVTQYDLKGQRVGWFASPAEASRSTKIALNAITGCANGHKATGGGYIWRRGAGNERLVLPGMPRPLGSKLRKEISQFDKDGKLIRNFKSIKEASRSLGIHQTTISAALRGDSITAGGFKWKIKH